MSAGVFRGSLAGGWMGDPQETWLARAPGGRVAGWYQLELPDLENRDRAMLELVVDPGLRRQGFGRDLLGHALDRAAGHGRSAVSGFAWRDSAGSAFARAAGADRGLVSIRSVQDLPVSVPPVATPADYTLESWYGPMPEKVLADVAALYDTLADAPHRDGEAPSRWDAARVRERLNGVVIRLGLRNHAIAARHDASGELAALTMVGLDPGQPAWGMQELTAVTRPHRGHRLGLVVKLAMLDLLASAEPQLEHIVTNNAEANDHMIAVNQALGYRIVGPPYEWWQLAGSWAQS